MKYLVFILALMMAVPPVQAGHCAMGGDESIAGQGIVDEHDCCPGESAAPAENDPSCQDGDHCGACYAGVSAVPVAFPPLLHERPDTVFAPAFSSLLPSHSAPPFRPPIS